MNEFSKKHGIAGIATTGAILIFLIFNVLISGCVDPGKFVKEGDNVRVNITEDNITRTFVIENISAQERNYPFEKDIIGMKVGEKKNIIYEDVVSVKLSQEPKANTIYNFMGRTIKVLDVNETHFLMGWHPLAGETLKFHVTIKNLTKRKSAAECLAKYNITADTIGFYYSDRCPHCIRMKPWIQEMEKQGYKFLWINVADAEKMRIAQECLTDILNFGRGVPQFACPSNAQWRLGAFESKDEMKNFADECKKSAELKSKIKDKTEEAMVEHGDFVEVEYVGRLTNGTTFDNGTVRFIVGHGQMIKGFEKGVIGMKMGESKELVIPPEEGYGLPESFPKIIPQEIPISRFKLDFNNENPVKGREYTNLKLAPWPLKVVDIKTITKNITIEILETGNFSFSCLEKYGIDKNVVIYYYTDWCPYCQRMKPWIKNLTNQGYKFFWVEAEKEPDKVKIVRECASDVINLDGGVPQFGCPANGKKHSGIFKSIENMKKFVEECNKLA